MNALTSYVCDVMLEHYESAMYGLSYSERKDIYESLVKEGCDEFYNEANTMIFETLYQLDNRFKDAITDHIDYLHAFQEVARQLYEQFIEQQDDTSDDTDTVGSTDCE